MKFSHFAKPVISLMNTVAAGSGDSGEVIDRFGFSQVVPFLACDGLPLDGVIDWKVQGGDESDGSDQADLTGAVGDTITVEDDTIVAAVNLTNTELTIAAQPSTPSRLRVEIVDTTPSITVGDVTITGKDEKGNDVSEVIAYTGGAVKTSVLVYSEVTSIVTSDFATLGGGGDETIEVGPDNSTGVHIGRLDGIMAPRYLSIVSFNVAGASGNLAGGFILLQEHRQESFGDFGEAEFGYLE